MRYRWLATMAVLLAAGTAWAEGGSNVEPSTPTGQLGVIVVTDDWTTGTGTSDCVTGWADDQWNLILTESQQVTVTATDCCCPGDFFEIYVDDVLIGTTPNLAPPWGCDFIGPLSSGSFSVTLCPGEHMIKVRDAGYDGHSPGEIEEQQMCPAGFTVSGTVEDPPPPPSEDRWAEERFGPRTSEPLPAEAARLQRTLSEIEPFVTTDERGLQRLDVAAARRSGVSEDGIEVGHRLVALDNRTVAAALAGQTAQVAGEDFAFIEPFFLAQAKDGSPCGDRRNPAPCPERIESLRCFVSLEAAREHLETLGYHRTALYAGGRYGRDFTRVLPHEDCGKGPFRDQAIVREQGASWAYNTQGLEPNPEILDYVWPYSWWPSYVAWWHFEFC